MFIDFTEAQAALRQEGHVCDPTECMSLGRQTVPPDGGRSCAPEEANSRCSGATQSNKTTTLIQVPLLNHPLHVTPKLLVDNIRAMGLHS